MEKSKCISSKDHGNINDITIKYYVHYKKDQAYQLEKYFAPITLVRCEEIENNILEVGCDVLYVFPLPM